MVFFGPPSAILSSRFISCTGTISGDELYHDSENNTSSLFIIDSLFIFITAYEENDSNPYRG